MPETKKYYHNLDVDNNKVINPLLNPLTTAQRTAVGTLLGPLDEGYVCFDTTLNQQYFWDGVAWVTVTASATWGSITGTITAQTDLTAYLAANYYPLSSNPANYIDLTDLSAGTGISYNNLTGVITNTAPDQTVALTSGTGISVTGTYPNFTITNTSPSSGGTVTGVTASSPLASSGGTAPNITIQQASGSQAGYLSSIDWTTFNSKQDAITLTTSGTSGAATFIANTLNIPQYQAAGTYVTSVGATGPITSSGGTTPTISTSMNTNKLIGRSTAGAGVMEEISVGTGLSLSGGTLSNSAPFTTPLTTKGDIYVRNSTVDTRLPVGLDTQVLIADSSTTTGLKWGTNTAATPTGYYGAWQDDQTQTAAVSNTGYAMIFRTVDLSNGVTVVTDGTNLTRITFANTGIYNLQFSSQFQNSGNSQEDVTIWLRLNGSDVAGSSGFVSVPARKSAGAGNEGHVIVSWNYLLNVVAGQYYELVWSTSNAANVTMKYYSAGSPPPSTASVILTVTQQSGIMAGTGITAINSLTGAVQTLATGTTGTDFAISSSGTTHTFNLPTASATNTGKLSSTDWSTFNGKVTANSTITGGTNLKITYDSKGLVTSGTTAATSDLSDVTAWTDYSASSTIVGFTTYAVKKLQYKKIDATTMLVQFQIESTANNGSGTTTSFTLPFSASSWGTQYFTYHAQNATTQTAAIGYITASSSVVTLSTSASTSNISSWTNAATRYIQGQIIVNI